MGLFDGWDWNSILATEEPAPTTKMQPTMLGTALNASAAALPGAVASIYGANKVANANQQAAQISAAGQRSAAQIAADNAAANRTVLTTQAGKAADMLQGQVQAGAPATEYLQSVIARDPNALTPAQTIQLADTRRQATNAITPGLSGSGRFRTASVRNVEAGTKAGMIGANTARSDAAASTLAARGAGAQSQAANLTANVGPQVAGVNTTAAKDIQGATTGAADTTGNALTSTADSNNVALGNIGSYFANAAKTASMPSSYQSYKLTPV